MASKRAPADERLVADCLAGRSEAWETLIRRYRRLIYSIPSSFGIRADGADEIFQRVAVRLFENLGNVREVQALAAWLIVTTRRECQAFLKQNRRYTPLDDDGPEESDPEVPDPDHELHEIACEHTLALALERLEAGCRELLTALYVEDPRPSYKEISERLGRPVGSLGPTRTRCLGKLRKIYEDLGGSSP